MALAFGVGMWMGGVRGGGIADLGGVLSVDACSCPLEPPCWVGTAGVKGRNYEREMHVPKHALFASPSSGGAGRSPYGREAARLSPTCPPLPVPGAVGPTVEVVAD